MDGLTEEQKADWKKKKEAYDKKKHELSILMGAALIMNKGF